MSDSDKEVSVSTKKKQKTHTIVSLYSWLKGVKHDKWNKIFLCGLKRSYVYIR